MVLFVRVFCMELTHNCSKLKAEFKRQINCVDPQVAKAFLQVELAGQKHSSAAAIELHVKFKDCRFSKECFDYNMILQANLEWNKIIAPHNPNKSFQ